MIFDRNFEGIPLVGGGISSVIIEQNVALIVGATWAQRSMDGVARMEIVVQISPSQVQRARGYTFRRGLSSPIYSEDGSLHPAASAE